MTDVRKNDIVVQKKLVEVIRVMKKRIAKVLAVVLAATMLLAGCGNGAGSGSDSGKIKDLYTWETSTREMEGFFILNTEKAADLNVLCNAYAGLVSTDSEGKLIPDVATEWGSEDGGLTWTFKLREGVKWVDVNGNEKADCTAQDWITALEWVLNYHKNGTNNSSMPVDTIKGAGEYMEWTKGLDEAEAKALGTEKFLEMVGIEAKDDYTLVYTCTSPKAYFDTVATSACLYPISQALIDELGVDNMIGMTNEQMWYTGPYTITSYINQNEKVLTKNDKYWDTECELFDTVTIKIISDTTVGYQLYENGEIDHIDLSEASLRTIYEDVNHKFHDQLVEKRARKYSYQMHLNFDKHFEDQTPDTNWNTAVANENFRQAMYYGLNLEAYWGRTNFINPLNCENLAYTMKGLLYFSDGTDYVDKVIEGLGLTQDGKTNARFDADKAAQYKADAMAELSAKGVTFPVEADYFIIAGSQTALDTATVLQQIFSDNLGDDFIKLNIKTYVSSQSKEVVSPRLQSFAINGWGADYGDVQNFLGQETYGEDTAYYAKNYSNINDATDADLIATFKEFTRLVNVADAITVDMDARYAAYVDAEVYMLQHALSIPMQYEVSWQLTKVNDYTKSNAMYGIHNYLYKNWETSVDAYTTEQYEAFAGAN